MNRPLSSVRPVGPVVSQQTKSVLGVTGTPMPNRKKNNIVVTFKLDGDHITLIDEFTTNVSRKVAARDDFKNPVFKYKRSGSSSKADFKNQAIIMELTGDELPIRESSLERVKGVIERAAYDLYEDQVTVQEVFIDQQ
jgi:hypothetical protein